MTIVGKTSQRLVLAEPSLNDMRSRQETLERNGLWLFKRMSEPLLADELLPLLDRQDWSEIRCVIYNAVSGFVSLVNNKRSFDAELIVRCILAASICYDDAAMDLPGVTESPLTGHQERVADLVVKVAKRLELPSLQVRRLRRAALLHDCGKLAVDPKILFKRREWTEEDKKTKPIHLIVGVEIVRFINILQAEANIIRNHHYRQGYRYGNRGIVVPRADEEISRQSQILAAVDVYDALSSPRARRSGSYHSVDKAFRIIKGENGTPGYGPPIDQDIIAALRETVSS